MIHIDVTDRQIEIEGHAGARGQSLPCEAVTVLVNTLVTSLDDLTADRAEYTVVPGYFKLERKDLRASAKLLIESFLVGVRLLAGAYKEDIELTEH